MQLRHYIKSNGRKPVEEFLLDQIISVQEEIFDAFRMLERGSVIVMPLSRSLSTIHRGLHELRFKDKRGAIRVVYFVKKGEAIYLLHAFRKKTQKMSSKDKDLILKRIKEI